MLLACPPVSTTDPKKGLPPASRANSSRGRFIPVLESRLLRAKLAPFRSSGFSNLESLRTTMKARCVPARQPGAS
jgi:hypothetical protein